MVQYVVNRGPVLRVNDQEVANEVNRWETRRAHLIFSFSVVIVGEKHTLIGNTGPVVIREGEFSCLDLVFNGFIFFEREDPTQAEREREGRLIAREK